MRRRDPKGSGVVAATRGNHSQSVGFAAYRLTALGLQTEIVGVVASAAPAFAESVAARQVVPKPVSTTPADGMAIRLPSKEALEIVLRGVARVIAVNEAEIAFAMRRLFTDTHNVAEGAAATALAGAIKGVPSFRVGVSSWCKRERTCTGRFFARGLTKGGRVTRRGQLI